MTSIALFHGDRTELAATFALADDSAVAIAAYRDLGEVLVARAEGRIVGHAQLVDTAEPSTRELRSLAVLEDWQGRGLGVALVDAAAAQVRQRGARRLRVATAAADTGNLRFYQRRGFRMLRVVRDAFGPATGYAEGAEADGIPLRDQVWLDLDLSPATDGQTVVIRSADDLTPDQIDAIEDRLYAVNAARTGHDDGRPLAFIAEHLGGLAGAVAGHSWGGICELRQVWVDEAHRGQGVGRSLMQAAIAEARDRGCVSIFLATYDFQAPGFYETLGFRAVAILEDAPVGHREYIMRLSLA